MTITDSTVVRMADSRALRPREPTPNGGFRIPDSAYDDLWIARVQRRVVISETGCWLWQGCITPTWRYAQAGYRGKVIHVHRQMYSVVHKLQLTREQYVCHTCDVRHCVNPDHLWLGSNSDNQKDSGQKQRHYESRRNHCEHGHEYTPENTLMTHCRPGQVSRQCKTCARIRQRIKNGWPRELAESLPPLPRGHRVQHVK